MQCGDRKAKPPAIEMIPMTPMTHTGIHTRVQKVIEEKTLEYMSIYTLTLTGFQPIPEQEKSMIELLETNLIKINNWVNEKKTKDKTGKD